jgi:DMSO/TMAO reductase YedYZ molybdopterin-dependent catalytic subunit
LAWKDPASVIVHSSTTIGTKRAAFGSGVITPAEQLYVRNNLPAPDASIVADRDAWEVSIEGLKAPRKLTLRELKTMGVETTAMVLQCSGNGRGYFPSKPSGTPWQVGAAGCVMWTGVPVRLLGGAESTAAARAVTRLMASVLKTARSDELQGCGHMAPMTDPERVNPAIEQFLLAAQLLPTRMG